MPVTAVGPARAAGTSSVASLELPSRTLSPSAYGEAIAKAIEARAGALDEWAVVDAFDEAAKGTPDRVGAVGDAIIKRLVADKQLDPIVKLLSGPDQEWGFVPSTRAPNYMPMVMYTTKLENYASQATQAAWKKASDKLPHGISAKLGAERGRQSGRQIERALDRRDAALIGRAVGTLTNTFAAVDLLKQQGFASPAELKRASTFAGSKLDAAIAQLKADQRLGGLRKALGTGAANQKVLASLDALVKAHGSATTQKSWAAGA